MLPRRLLPLLLCPTLTSVLFGCQHFDRAKECRSVSALVNPVLQLIDDERRRAPGSSGTYRTIATQYDRLGSALAALQPENRRLVDAVTDYAKLTREGARDARLFADALDAKDDVRIATTRIAASKTAKHEASSISHWDSACRSGR